MIGEFGWSWFLPKERAFFPKMGHFSREWILSVGEDVVSNVFIIIKSYSFSLKMAFHWVVFSIYCFNLHSDFLLVGTASFAWLVVNIGATTKAVQPDSKNPVP